MNRFLSTTADVALLKGDADFPSGTKFDIVSQYFQTIRRNYVANNDIKMGVVNCMRELDGHFKVTVLLVASSEVDQGSINQIFSELSPVIVWTKLQNSDSETLPATSVKRELVPFLHSFRTFLNLLSMVIHRYYLVYLSVFLYVFHDCSGTCV